MFIPGVEKIGSFSQNAIVTVISITINSCFCSENCAQQPIAETVNIDNIKAVQLYQQGKPLSYPIINLFTPEKLLLSFDYLAEDQAEFYYRIQLCNADWTHSDMFYSDFIDGYQEHHFEGTKPSFNTQVHYFHYQLVLPNSNTSFLLSGNYVVEVFRPDNPDLSLFTKRFFVVNNICKVEPLKDTRVEGYEDQQVEFAVSTESGDEPISAIVYQNLRWDISSGLVNADYADFERYTFSYNKSLLFPAGNEFMGFDFKDLDFVSIEVDKIEYEPPYHWVTLKPAESKKAYFYSKDLNGRYFIKNNKAFESGTEEEYCYVKFTANAPFLTSVESLYVVGDFNQWQTNDANKLVFNGELLRYECDLLLKQGYYNYAIVNQHTQTGTKHNFAGNFNETENDYVIFIYRYSRKLRYDELIGATVTNTREQK